jgi:hypothetical protein
MRRMKRRQFYLSAFRRLLPNYPVNINRLTLEGLHRVAPKGVGVVNLFLISGLRFYTLQISDSKWFIGKNLFLNELLGFELLVIEIESPGFVSRGFSLISSSSLPD